MHISFKLIKLYFSFILLDMFHTPLLSIISSFLLLHMQSLVTVWFCVGCFLQQGWRKQHAQNHTVTRDCMCSNKKLLMMDTVVSETCQAE
jgi:hypothetical protein